MRPLCYALALAGAALALPAQAQDAEPLTLTITDKVENTIDHRLFGHFLERPSWGTTRQETGPERAYHAPTDNLHPEVVGILDRADVPVIRWPGGTDVDHMNWTDMIDNAPDREQAARPASVGHTGESVTNRFGMDEALNLAEEIESEMILVVNLLDGLSGKRTVEEAALHEAGLIAYATAPLGADLPEGMPDYPALRAQNGRAEPWNVRYAQIGNEWFLFRDANGRPLLPFGNSVDPDVEERLYQVLDATIAAIHAVDPDIEIILDGMNDWFVDGVRERLGDRVDYLTFHQYHPWALNTIERDNDFDGTIDETFEIRSWVQDPANRDETWYAWIAPRRVDEDGRAVLPHNVERTRRAGYPLVSTEWNWNGRYSAGDSGGFLESYHARGLGSTSYLFEMMREGGDVVLATQSMTVGWNWQIAGIAYPAPGSNLAYRRPSFVSTTLLAAHHGDERVDVTYDDLPTYAQPFKMGTGIYPKAEVALVDPIATRTADSVYVHLIHRHFDRPQTVRLDLSAYDGVGGVANVYSMVGSPVDEVGGSTGEASGAQFEVAWVEASTAAASGKVVELTLPPASLTTVAVPVGRSVAAEGGAEAGPFRLRGVAPNPARGDATVRFDLAEAADVSVRVFDVLGREVLAAPPQTLAAGAGRSVSLDVSALPAGIYVVRLAAGADAVTGRFTVVR